MVNISSEQVSRRATRNSRAVFENVEPNRPLERSETTTKESSVQVRRSERLMSTTATEVTAEKSTKASKANVETVGTTEPLEEQRGRHILQLKESKSRKRSCSANSKQASRKKNKLDGTTDGTTHQHYNLVLIPFDASKFTTGLSKYDKCCKGKVLYTPEYAPDIFQRLFECESRNAPLSYMHLQSDINSTMRAVVVDWLVELHMKFRCVPESLYLAVNIFDRYLNLVDIDRADLQLVAVTSLLIATKYEEIYPAEVRDCVLVTDRSYTKQNIIDAEAEICKEIQFSLSVATGYPFLRRFLFVTKASRTMECAANYYMERMLQEHDAIAFRPSVIAAAAVCLAINHPEIRDADQARGKSPGVPRKLLDYSGYTTDKIYHAAELVAEKVSHITALKSGKALKAVRRKFGSSRYQYVADKYAPPDAIDILGD